MKSREFSVEDAYQIFMSFLSSFWYDFLKHKMADKGLVSRKLLLQKELKKLASKELEKANLYDANDFVLNDALLYPGRYAEDLKYLLEKKFQISNNANLESLRIKEEVLFQIIIDFCVLYNNSFNNPAESFPKDGMSFAINWLEDMRKCPEVHKKEWALWNRAIDDQVIRKIRFFPSSFKAKTKGSQGELSDLDCLVEEAKFGILTDEQLEYVAQRIKDFDPSKEDDSTLCDLLRVIEESDTHLTPENIYSQPRAIKYRKVIEPFLEYSRFDIVPAIVLRTLCQPAWGFAKDYLDIIKKFVKEDERDFGDASIVAISEAGEYLNKIKDDDFKEKDIELAQLLKSIMDDKTHHLTNAAYEAVARALGVPWEDLLSFPRQFSENEFSEDKSIKKKS